jgi:hypothetical protein
MAIPELFATRYRYTGTALAVNVAGVAGGAVPLMIAGTLQATYGQGSRRFVPCPGHENGPVTSSSSASPR